MRVRTETVAAYTLDLDDVDAYVRFTNVATASVPPNRVIPFAIGDTITVEQAGSGALTIAAGGGCTINGAGTLAGQYETAKLVKVGDDEWTCSGSMSLGDFEDDAAAEAGGVPIGGRYRDGSIVMVRVA